MKSTKRDWIIMISIVVLAFLVYFGFEALFFNKKSNGAEVIYTPDGTLAYIDFEKETITKSKNQSNIPDSFNETFPIIKDNQITVLGDYTINGVRQIVVIEVNFSKSSVKIVKEESPNNICSKLGEQTNKPLICLPNNVRVSFTTDLDIDDEF